MNFSDVLKALNSASAFELYRMRAAIDRVLDDPSMDCGAQHTRGVRPLPGHPPGLPGARGVDLPVKCEKTLPGRWKHPLPWG